MLCDDGMAIIGSANFDHRSFRLNFEISMLLHDHGVASELEQLIARYMEGSEPVQADRERLFWRCRLPEALARLMSPLL